jgi:hypothetical protein
MAKKEPPAWVKPEDQRDLLDHLKYEIKMLNWTSKPPKQLVEEQACAFDESFCMHARVLIDFFHFDLKGKDKPKFENDAFAEYFTDGNYASAAMSKELIKLWRKISVQIAHLSYKRPDCLNSIGKTEREKLHKLIEEDIEKFEQHLLPCFREHWETPLPSMFRPQPKKRV